MDNEAKQLAEEYANYLVVDVNKDVQSVADSIDDTLTRLDEFAGLVDVISSQNDPQIAQDMLLKKSEIFDLFQRVRKFEFALAQIRQTVDTFDHLVSKAEIELNATTEGKIKNFLKSLSKKKSPTSPTSPSEPSPVFTNPPIFSTKDIFHNSSEQP
ncbi:biogenesis of lysosomal organelles complex-1, subunit 4, cappuccino [Nesidiocoris tenuis]|uniref:Biogenesis of lysosomal organelles complex-1, subunit 4, cappuccino n=1 Tax=Nesidiocoris tenuis TaxID=355587 RepID=A0ABN7AIY7_9HEMI|nr:biogenesis of lysosomal organelles complex-1, subunit 4, cappuccino [Nesidiocoris tenuis]